MAALIDPNDGARIIDSLESMIERARSIGFILSPVDDVRGDSARARENVAAMIDEWRRLRA